MIIKKLQINGFGNLENKTIEFNNGLNLLYGENEAGKSMICNFIKCIFYGINKNKAGNEFSEFERFKPWKDIDFSGKIEYEIDGKGYTVFRDFNRNNCKVYDENANDITDTFNKDKNRGAEIGLFHLGIDEETFMNTLFVNQSDVSVEMQSQKNVTQKLINILQSGQENISFEKIKNKLQKKILDEIGTERTQNKPINLVNKEIYNKEQLREKLLSNREKKGSLDENSKEIDEQLKKIDNDMDELKQVIEIREKYSKILDEKEKTFELTLKIKEKEEKEKKQKMKTQFKIYLGIISVFSILIASILCYYKNYWWIIIEFVFVILLVLIFKLTNRADSNSEQALDFAVIKEDINKKEQKELDKLIQSGVKETLIERKIQELKSLLAGLENKKNDLILDGYKIRIEEGSLKENIERLSEIEEELVELNDKKEQLYLRRNIINIAIDKLNEAYEDLKKDVIPEMEENIKLAIQETTNRKYINIYYNNDRGILTENSVGEIVPASKLSVGTIDQFYLGFRLGISKSLGEVPIILDESFAYFDNTRLSNILSVMKNLEKQIIIFTCTNREKLILEDLNINYTHIEI